MIIDIYELYCHLNRDDSSYKMHFIGRPSIYQVVAYTQSVGMPLPTEKAEELLRSGCCVYKGAYWMLGKQEVIKGEG